MPVPPTPPDARAVFFDKIVQRTTGLLPVPAVSKHGSKSLPPRVCLRRSRRLAGAEADVVPTDMGGRVQKKAMRSLGIINEHEGINQQAQNDYAKLFGQPLSDSHLQALTALFFWSLPEELEPGSDDVLMETKITAISQRVILSALGSDFTGYLALPSVGASGGILVAWRHHVGISGAQRVDNFSMSIQFSTDNGQTWWLTCVYGPQGNEDKIQFLQELRDIRATCQGPWMIAGDFNLIYKDEDKNNVNYNRAMMGRFRRFINDLALKEIPLHGRKYTWSNQQDSPTLVKLDRVLCSVDWEDKFPNCLLQSLASEDSDHCPLLLGLQNNKVGRRRFHFESFWTILDGFQEAVAAAWMSVPTGSCPYLTLSQKFKATAKGLQRWSSKKENCG
ncbi:unnamed protein product [Miscanthus lutarioriparius]|uniref:Endonuclease/exonuclease/phosphatase domain-containing protein n=1 Tax=Miscanthus lutarioriparius TaxID=422564 RepID=A0A811QDU2_9POAL|nr:unnamed protein product [Miscanthus lutarioriparius]